MNSSNADPSLYQLFGNVGISPLLVSLVGIRWLTGTIGVFLNISLIYVTIRNKNLHGSCNLFIATQSLFETLTMASFSFSFSLVITGSNFITLGQCMNTIFWASFANLMRKLALYLVSVERLLMICFPMIFAQKPMIFYGVAVCIASAYSAFVVYLTWAAVLDPGNVTKPVICTIPDLTDTGSVGTFVLANGLVIVGLSALNYVLLWAILRWNTDTSEKGKATRQYTKKIYKMLLILTCLAIFGWMLNPTMRLLLPYLNLTKLQNFYVSIGLTCATNVSMLLDPLVLYYFSKDYKNGFRKAFPRWLGAPSMSQMAFTKVVTIHPPNSQQKKRAGSQLVTTTAFAQSTVIARKSTSN